MPTNVHIYDRFGHIAFGAGRGGGGGAHGMNMDDIFSQFGDIFGEDVFGNFFGGGSGRGQRKSRGVRGSNLRVKIKVNYEEIANGATKTIKVKKYISCSTCNGSGARDKNSAQTCGTCGGNGQVRKVQNTFLGQMQTVTTCPACNGEGTTIVNKCTSCKGEGRVYGEETVTLDIPAGFRRACN
jgi:molecular chaperone DnaJ